MESEVSDADLEAYLDESLDEARSTEIENAVRNDPSVLERLGQINGRRDAGVHTIGEIWRHNQIGVPTAEQMADFLSGKLEPGQTDYIDFRINILKCPFTIALQVDQQSNTDTDAESKARRRRLYQSSAGLLKKKK